MVFTRCFTVKCSGANFIGVEFARSRSIQLYNIRYAVDIVVYTKTAAAGINGFRVSSSNIYDFLSSLHLFPAFGVLSDLCS